MNSFLWIDLGSQFLLGLYHYCYSCYGWKGRPQGHSRGLQHLTVTLCRPQSCSLAGLQEADFDSWCRQAGPVGLLPGGEAEAIVAADLGRVRLPLPFWGRAGQG